MKILHVTGLRSTKFGAVERFICALASSSNDTYIIASNCPPLSELAKKNFDEAGCAFETLDIQSSHGFKSIIPFIRLLRKYRPDIVHFHFTQSFALLAPVAKMMGVKKIYKTEHSCLEYNAIQAHKLSDLSLAFRVMSYGGWAYRFLTADLAVSDYVDRQLKKVLGAKVNSQRIYIGVEEPKPNIDRAEMRQQLGIRDDEILAASIMFASPIKGCDILLRAFAETLKHESKYRLIIIGLNENSAYTKQMKAYSDELGISDSVIWTGITDNVSKYLAASDVFVQPSRTEALSLAAVEAAAMRLPVIGSNVGGLPEVSTEIFEVGDCKGLSQLLVANATLDHRNKMGCLARQRYEQNFKLEKGVSAYKAIYHS